jgi:hypothetical protein
LGLGWRLWVTGGLPGWHCFVGPVGVVALAVGGVVSAAPWVGRLGGLVAIGDAAASGREVAREAATRAATMRVPGNHTAGRRTP